MQKDIQTQEFIKKALNVYAIIWIGFIVSLLLPVGFGVKLILLCVAGCAYLTRHRKNIT
jgi:hypothetical protein